MLKKLLKRLLTLYPNEVLPYLIYGNILFTENYYIKAINNFKKALKIEKNNVDALTNLAKIYRELNQYNESLYYISILIRINKMNYEIHETLGNIYFDLDKYEDAKKSYLKSIELNKENFQAYQNLGILQLFQGDFRNGWYNYDFKWDNKIYYSNRPNFFCSKMEFKFSLSCICLEAGRYRGPNIIFLVYLMIFVIKILRLML